MGWGGGGALRRVPAGPQTAPAGCMADGQPTWSWRPALQAEPNRITGGFNGGDKQYVVKCLSDIAKQLRRCGRPGPQVKAHRACGSCQYAAGTLAPGACS